MLNRTLIAPALLGALVLWAGSLLAQSTAELPAKADKTETKTEPIKPMEKKVAKKEDVKTKPTVDKMKVPKGAILVIVDEIKQALSLVPNAVVLTPERYQELLDQIQALEKQVKPDKRSVFACKLTGKLEDDFIVMRAEFLFTTDQPHTIVPLGLQGGYLVNEGELDQQIPALDHGDDGFMLKVPSAGTHRLALNLKVPVGLRRTGAAGGGERGFELGLPAASVTTLMLDLPASIKEIRWNDNLEKKRQSKRWELLLGSVSALNVSWKEPATLPGSGPLLSVEGQITVKVEESSTLLQADLVLEDLRGQTKDWQLILPPKSKVDVKVPSGLIYDLQASEADLIHTIKFTEKHAERFSVHVQARYPRPFGPYKLPVGPFLVQNAYRQQGTIVVQAPTNVLRGQRLIFHRYGEVFQRDIPKGPTAPEVAAIFQYWNMAGPAKAPKMGPNPKIPLEIEWKTEKGPVEAVVDHQVALHRIGTEMQVDYQARIKLKTFYPGLEFLDVQIPRPRAPFGLFAWCPPAPFPAAVPWGGVVEDPIKNSGLAWPTRFLPDDEGSAPEAAEPDAQGKTRIKFLRPSSTKEFSFLLVGKYVLPWPTSHFRVELPQVLGILNRPGKVQVSADPDIELLLGPRGQEEPVPDTNRYQLPWAPGTKFLELAWRQHVLKVPAQSLTDVTLRGKNAHIRQQLAWTGKARRESTNVRLKVPKSIQKVTVVSGGSMGKGESSGAPDNGIVLIQPAKGFPETTALVLEYDQALPTKEKEIVSWSAPQIWPEEATHLEAKVRVWSEPGVLPQLSNRGDVWKERGTEIVPGRDALPALVVQAIGEKNLDLTLRLPPADQNRLPFVCEGGLIQATVDDAGNHHYRARFLIVQLNTDTLEMTLPIPVNTCLQNVTLDKYKILWDRSKTDPNVAILQTKPELFRHRMVLDIEYKVPASFADGQHYWQTVLFPPVFKGEVFLGRVRWLVNLPNNWVSVLAASNIQVDYRWTFQGWLLTPEPIGGDDMEAWLPHESAFPVSQAFSRSTQEPIVLVHLKRQTWLLLCSVLVLACGLLLFFLPLSRSVFWVVVVSAGLLLVAGGFLWPSWVPPLLFGMQPGLVVVLLLAGVHWLMQERYRRQVIFMPGFTRLKPGSSLLRSNGTNPRPREASTVDAPASASGQSRGSSINQGTPG